MEVVEREDREVQWNKERNEVVFVVTTKTLEGNVVGARVSRHGGQMYAVSVATGQLKLLNEPPGDGRDMGRYGMAYDRSFDLCEGGSEVLFSTLRFSSERGSYSTARLLFEEPESVVVGQRGGSWIDGDYGEIHPRCQPGGGWIAALVDDRVFQGGEEASGFGLYLMDYEGENSRRVDSAGRTSHIAPRWSPNGKALAFVDVEGRVSAVEVESGRVWKGGQLGLEGDFAWAPCSCAGLCGGHGRGSKSNIGSVGSERRAGGGAVGGVLWRSDVGPGWDGGHIRKPQCPRNVGLAKGGARASSA